MNPLVSVIIPVYNRALYVEEAVRSALSQTMSAIEVIAVDDGSTDDSSAILDRMQWETKGSDRTLIVLHQPHSGEGAARNAAFRRARGNYIAYIDSDDRWHPHKLERHLEVLSEHSEYDVTYCWFRIIDEHGRKLRSVHQSKTFGFEDLVAARMAHMSFSTLVARRAVVERIDGVDETLTGTFSDLNFLLQISALRAGNIGCVPSVLVDYRVHQGQVTGRDWQKDRRNWEYNLRKAECHDPAAVARAKPEGLARRSCYWAHIAYRDQDYKAARELIWEGWTASPSAMLTNGFALCFTAQVVLFPMLPDGIHARVLTWGRKLRGAWHSLDRHQ